MFRTAARIRKWIAGFSIAALITAAPFPAYAADPVAAVIGAAVTAAMYKTCLSGVLKMGNDVHAQINAWKQDIKDMVEKDYNHPSVIMYSTGNEV